ncbi:hypothetical protein NXF25_001775 [Crotalus adamanteus]|uniref:Uncharacterized protein n=1 Tax=Crotalus adamanteus TaxID=8729 RepID=A0AAW1C860_CROAD
MELEHPPLDF